MNLRTRRKNTVKSNTDVRTPVIAILSAIIIALSILVILGRVT